jgi:hypothetical protein
MHASSRWIGSSCTGWIKLIGLKMYCLMYGTIFKSCPKLITYLVSKIWVLMSLKISSKDFFGILVCAVKWTSCLLPTSWFIGFGRPTPFEWNDPFRSIGACDVESPLYNFLIVWTKESHIYVLLFINQLLFLPSVVHVIWTHVVLVLGYIWW